MAFLGAGEFFSNLMEYRVCSFVGHMGSGKTLSCIAIAHRLLLNRIVESVWSNVPHVMPQRMCNHALPCLPCMERTVYILDETWGFADSRKSQTDFSGYGAYVRKLDSIFLAPSVYDPDKRLRQMRVERIANLLFLDWWVYRWEIYDSKVSGIFVLRRASDYFGTFPTKYKPLGDAGMKEAFESLRVDTTGNGGRWWLDNMDPLECEEWRKTQIARWSQSQPARQQKKIIQMR